MISLSATAVATRTRTRHFDAVVIGGGIIGCSVALYLREKLGSVLLLEREPILLGRASYANQARVHNGYHYPRSLLTGMRSSVNFPRFVHDFEDCVDRDFEKYYAIARRFSKVTADQFSIFCRRIGVPAERAPAEVRRLFDRQLIEDVFVVREYAFNAVKLRERLQRELATSAVEVQLDAEARLVSPDDKGIRIAYVAAGEESAATGRYVFNCTYSNLNQVLQRSGIDPIALSHELTELALVEMPPLLRRVGVTVMCGPFFSFMPFPDRGLHSFSHVRYTPHRWWQDQPGNGLTAEPSRDDIATNFPRMLLDAQRYMPSLATTRYVDSLWETKTVLPSSEVDDSRPILFKWGHGLDNLVSILGGKIDNIYDVLAELDAVRANGGLR